MQNHIVDEKAGIPYTLVGDNYLPWGDLFEGEPKEKPIGIWGQRHFRHIRHNNRIFYTSVLTSGKLNNHLSDIDSQANEMFSWLVKEMAMNQGITEQLKAIDQMALVGAMNNIRNSATEIVTHNLIFILERTSRRIKFYGMFFLNQLFSIHPPQQLLFFL